MLTHVNTDQRFQIFQAIDDGTAERIDAACFVDGMEDEYRVDFFRVPFGGEVVRVCYNRRTTRTEMNWVEGFARWEFDARYAFKEHGAGI